MKQITWKDEERRRAVGRVRSAALFAFLIALALFTGLNPTP
ncbi:MAG: hypothetical protein Q8Q08_12960 [Candidatus Omnitrophota bacterium]|nr:hypothetical protein [Candidatus Omnitrophota bacterium]